MRVEIPLIIFISLWMPVLGWSQDCDCLDSDNCPLAIEANTTGQVCYDITDALNNNLADPNQGICGVRLTFTHRHIWDLELSLVSPSGQVVPLVGPNTNAFGTTNNVLWDVLFIPCSGNAQPDTINGNPLSEVWDNDQNWPFAAVLTGTYFPTGNNCLEAFNSGPVNGSWCLQIDNQPSTYTGEIINFEVLLCDNSGLLCCDAEGGNLPGPDDLTLCEGNADLMLDFDVNYGPLPPDTLEYGYTWLISDTDGLLLEIDTLPDLTAYLPGSYQVCGLSYLLADSL
ncbi:MAG: proprotein convertase P-domain-containing protein, partial [Saprospiraceae bacterium]|nr:proprotein convertase P-domain-containing protein [Saprospiraceae bacterium]